MFHCCLIVLSSVCTVLCLIAILDVQANQRARCDIHCHWKSGIFSLPTHQQHSVCMPGKPSSSFQGAVKNHSDSSPASLSYQKIWLNNPQGFGIQWWELPEALQSLFSQPENSTVHISQGYSGQELEFLYRAHQAHLSLLKTQDQTHRAGRNFPFPSPTACSPWVLWHPPNSSPWHLRNKGWPAWKILWPTH